MVAHDHLANKLNCTQYTCTRKFYQLSYPQNKVAHNLILHNYFKD
ncbi:hypothetical protein VCRA2126O85_390021 [Vibrio crassostreae]|nr:hypothetical protein VCRA2128O106_380021 [Vibrio crassostreae]CAK2910852.1 hypothetical protein VCRA2125O83_380021 [Vibrio crassostreae]CAK2915556.1 hypothetical protein VCRA2126O85_390021 [Vibrio crassostreae]CAK2915852.1 hypothetical protein VCRA2126O84_390021 [Vibrio crassostreae]CAK2937020.1 hypothetical protein VCRA2128O100_400021 [Vibrio crassostreae]